jgi:hypothetical protein
VRTRATECDPSGVTAYQLEADLLRSIGASGGWSPAARERFVKLAHARGVDARTAAQSIGPLAGAIGRQGGHSQSSSPLPAASSAVVRAQPMPAAAPRAAQARPSDPDRRGVPVLNGTAPAIVEPVPAGHSVVTSILLVSAVVVLMVLAAGITLLVVGGDDAPPELNTPAPPVVRAPSEPPTQPAIDPERPTAEREIDNAPAILHELEVASEGLAVDPDAAFAGFERAVRSLASRWGGFSVADRLAAQDLVIGFVYRVSGRSAMLDRAFAVIAEGVENTGDGTASTDRDVWRAAWSMGTLVRLRREENLPGSLSRRIDGAIVGVLSDGAPNARSFRAGAIAMLRTLADPLSEVSITIDEADSRNDAGKVWGAWIDAVRAASLGDSELVETMLIGAVDSRLRHGSRNDPRDAEILEVLVGAMDWSDDSGAGLGSGSGSATGARAWLVRAFADRSLGIDELHAATLALANASAAGGVNHAMVLARGAGESERRALRERFRELWGISADTDAGESVAAFLIVARDALDTEWTAGGSGFGLNELSGAVRLARLNAAAAMLWRAEPDAATDLIDNLDGPIDAVLAADDVPDLTGLLRTGGGTWAQEYLSAGSHIERRLELLSTVGGRSALGPMAAEVIVMEALRGSPIRIRQAAAEIVEAEADSPVIVNAMLETLPLMPRSARNGAIVERVAGVPLPDVGDASWDLEARRALVERLLELIAGRGTYARLDALSGLLDSAYTDRLARPGARSGAGVSAGSAMVLPADAAARDLASRWIAAAERRPPVSIPGLSVESIDSRLAARLSSADGIVQVFHAHQLALAEAMALVIAGEGPGRAAMVESELDELMTARGRTRSVLRQIERTERFMLRLWVARLEEGI